MAITAKDVGLLHDYIEGVMNRADHHADEIKGSALALLGGIIWRGRPGTIEIKQYAGNMANMIWATIGSKRYAFSYNHVTKSIDIRDRTQSGQILYSINDQMPVSDIEVVVRTL